MAVPEIHVTEKWIADRSPPATGCLRATAADSVEPAVWGVRLTLDEQRVQTGLNAAWAVRLERRVVEETT